MSWTVDVKSYRATAVQFQIQNLSKGMHNWADDFKKSLGVEKATFVVKTMFTEKLSNRELINEENLCKYDVVNSDFTKLIEKISGFALGKQNSFGVFVQMEEEEDDDLLWLLSYESFYGSVVQERKGYTREQMLETLGLTESIKSRSEPWA